RPLKVPSLFRTLLSTQTSPSAFSSRRTHLNSRPANTLQPRFCTKSIAPQRASQCDHGCKASCQLVVAGAAPTILLQPTKHPLDDVTLPIFRATKQPG